MLQLFKKSGRGAGSDDKTPGKKRLSVSSSCSDTFFDEDLNDEDWNADPIESRSRLSMNLVEIIRDKNCLSYFVQFLDVKKALSLIKFYIDAESFKTATEISLSIRPTQSDVISNDYYLNPCSEMSKSFSLEGYDSLSFKSFDVCDTISMCSQSENNLRATSIRDIKEEGSPKIVTETKSVEVPELTFREPLTDDEKSQIFAESTKRKSDNLNAKKMEKSSSAAATDAIRIYRKYLTLNSTHYIDIPATILSSISLALCAEKDDNADCFSVTANCFVEAQKYVLEKLEKEYLNEFLESPFYSKYCVEILSSPALKLPDILHSESALFYFMEYLEQENQRNCLEFWLAATNFRTHYESHRGNTNKEEVTNDAMILYEKYFSLQSPSPLKFSDRVRSRVEELICGDVRMVPRCFDFPLKVIEKHLETKYFNNFLMSQLFTNFVTELKLKIGDHKAADKSGSLTTSRHRKTRSDCTAESSRRARNSFISQQNTLLAMESLKSSKSNKVAGTDMQIDSRQLTNPDLLWHRSSTNGLSFGRVNSLGRYERDFDLGSPDEKWTLSSGGSKIKNAMRKLVNLPEDKVQEEIAWQVAEMIVKDITSITLGNTSSDT